MEFSNEELDIMCTAFEELDAQLWYLIENEELDAKHEQEFKELSKEVNKIWAKIEDYLGY